jgi:hypothetical protein
MTPYGYNLFDLEQEINQLYYDVKKKEKKKKKKKKKW